MKRTIACLMVAVMLLVSLMGCAGKQAASDADLYRALPGAVAAG